MESRAEAIGNRKGDKRKSDSKLLHLRGHGGAARHRRGTYSPDGGRARAVFSDGGRARAGGGSPRCRRGAPASSQALVRVVDLPGHGSLPRRPMF
jgi:hypothetical protein